jgi:DNA-binding FadR family transcriptional regulator
MREPGHTRHTHAEVDLGFHLAVGTASGNALMRGIAAVIEAALVASFTLSSAIDEPALFAASIANHEAVVDAIEAHDSEAAAAAMLKVISAGVSRIAAYQQTRGSARALSHRLRRV